MRYSDACELKLRNSEGCKLKAYPDPESGGDPWTIGFGATGVGITRNTRWTQAQADADLTARLTRLSIQLEGVLKGAKTTQNQFDALIMFAYNTGLKALADSTLLRKHRAGDYKGAKVEFSKWVHAAGHVSQGLINRRAREAALYGKA